MVDAGKRQIKQPKLIKMSKEEIEKLTGQYDKDSFYLLDAGGFYDPEGFHYDENGIDAIGGFYDNAGVYIAPKQGVGSHTLNEDGRSVLCIKLGKEEIEAIDGGAYDEDRFYVLEDKSYYDPLGY